MQVFRHVVELKSFAAAAARLKLSPAMASKHVMHLERHLGARLLNRTSRSVSLTEDGRLYYGVCRQMLESLDEAEAAISKATFAPKGLLRISAPVWAASAPFASVLASFRRKYPDVTLEVDLSGRLVGLVEEGFDLALRVSHSPGDTLVALPVGSVTFKLVASPGYLRRAGLPTSPLDLASREMLWYSLAPTDLSSLGFGPLKLSPVLSSSNESLLHQAALAGMGLAMLPTWLIAEDIGAGTLVQVLSEQVTFDAKICGMYPSRKYLSSKVRAFLDFLRDEARLSL